MATEKQLIALEKIKKVVDRTPNKMVPKKLSRGHIGYEKALSSIMLAGEWAVAVSIITVSLAIIFLAAKQFGTYDGLRDYEIYLSVFSIILSITSGVLGYKLWHLEATPLFTLVILLALLVFNIFMVVGILPAISAVIDIVALSRYTTFCSWFRGVR